jgi:subtilisin family serine protease
MPQDTWNLVSVKQQGALAKLPRTADGKIDWGTVRVAHLDTGFTRHEAFGKWTAAGRNDVVLAHLGRDYFDNDNPTAEDPLTDVPPPMSPGHGTRTSSALAGVAIEIASIAPGLPLVPFRVNDQSLIGERACRAIGDAIKDAVDRTKCQIVSISLGFPVVLDREMGQGVDYAYDRGVIVVGAAGQEVNKICYPGKHRRALCAAGYTRANRIYYPYESYARLDVWAPADHVWRGDVGDDRFGEGDGTSYAVPHVVAAAAMWLRVKGDEIATKYPEPWQRVEAFRRVLAEPKTTLPFKSPKDNEAGKLNMQRVLSKALPAASSLEKEADQAGDDVF